MPISSYLKKSIKFIIPGILFYATFNMFFNSFDLDFSANSIALLLLLSAVSAFGITRRKALSIIPSMLFASGSIVFLISIGKGPIQAYFIMFAAVVFTITLIGLSRFFTPEEERTGVASQPEKIYLLDSGFNLNQTVIMCSVFFLSSGIYGTYIITGFAAWQMMLIMFVGIFLAAYYLIRINFLKSQEMELHLDYSKNRTFGVYSFLSALLMIELVWAMTFLPINHLTFGAIILSVFFAYWNIVREHLRNNLTRKGFIGNMAFMMSAILIVISTSRLYIN